jgi:hypothetical protein
MIPSSDKRSDTPRTLFKIVLMLGLALAGVAAIAAEPEPTPPIDMSDASPGCAKATFEFGGRITQNGEPADSWTLTCQRRPAALASTPKPVDVLPVAAQPQRPPRDVQGIERF